MARPGGGQDDSWEYSLRKYLLLLASLVATVTYGAGFNPPGGVWQTADRDKGHIAGDPIIRDTRNNARYLVFFYSNATAFASSLVVIVLILILSLPHDRGIQSPAPLCILRGVMVLDLISLMMAYAAGTFRDVLTAVYSLLLLTVVVAYLVIHLVLASRSAPPAPHAGDRNAPEQLHASPSPQREERTDDSAVARLRKVLMLLATFAVSVTYLAGLSAPGGFWDHPEDGHEPGDAILKGGPHDARLKAFFVCNTTAFVASLLILVMLLEKKLCFSKKVRYYELYGLIAVTLIGLVAAYAAGSSREIDTTIYVSALVGAVVICILVQVVIIDSCLWKHLMGIFEPVSSCLRGIKQSCLGQETNSSTSEDGHEQQQQQTQTLEKARSLVLLLATLAAAITYQAGLNPPGGLWQNDDDGGHYKNGDPILLTTNPRRFKVFYYCNSIAFVASLVAIILARMKTLHHHNALEAAMILDLLGLIGAYAAGSSRDVNTSINVMAIAGAVLVYVVIHVVFLTLDHKDGSSRGNDEASLREKEAEELLEKRRKRLLLFAILAATITYQAGLTPPGGFLVNDDGHAGDPVLLNNYWRRYKAFFYCNSVSFMLSIALIILLVNPNLYRPAIRSNALSVCTAAGLIGIMGGYAAGCTQHLKTSIYIFALAAVVLGTVVLLVAVFFVKHLRKQEDKPSNTAAPESPPQRQGAAVETVENATGAEQRPAPVSVAEQDRRDKKSLHAKRKYLMLLGILAASVTYQSGLAPPGGSWQSNVGTHTAGDSVMHDNRRARYLAFFYSNSTSFVASVVVIVLLLPPSLHEKPWWLVVMNMTIVLDLLGLLVAYAAGSSRTWQTSVYVSALVLAVLAYFAIHVALSSFIRRGKKTAPATSSHPDGVGNGGHQAQLSPSVELSEVI
ncbi:hypothetical protein BAE44_0004781 [Dichanthelium oligosanthes]|uniref:PGG domain-containing protein n=1 Tax=Dichanthelium oligosanthes TaxID=888268 RepID=A0A1E5WAC6_9POAL|nr:hypothetical protein BAE44_0004781 [Dichanthelium oligosanthes]